MKQLNTPLIDYSMAKLLTAYEISITTTMLLRIYISLLFTAITPQISAKEADGSPVSQDLEVDYETMILPISSGNLVTALDESMQSSIPNYTSPLGHTTVAEKLMWLRTIPTVLTYQLQRVHYDPDKKRAVKDNSEFIFPENIFMARYMLQNKVRTDMRYTLPKNFTH